MLRRFSVLGIAALMVALAVPAVAQDFRGRINGTVTDNSGADSTWCDGYGHQPGADSAPVADHR